MVLVKILSCPFYPCHSEVQSCDHCYCPIYPCEEECTGGVFFFCCGLCSHWRPYEKTIIIKGKKERVKRSTGLCYAFFRTTAKMHRCDEFHGEKVWDCSGCDVIHRAEISKKIPRMTGIIDILQEACTSWQEKRQKQRIS